MSLEYEQVARERRSRIESWFRKAEEDAQGLLQQLPLGASVSSTIELLRVLIELRNLETKLGFLTTSVTQIVSLNITFKFLWQFFSG